MDPFRTGRPLLPKPMASGLGGQPFIAHEVPPVQQGLRQPRSTSKTEEEWEAQKPNFRRLYVEEDLPLKVAMEEMEKQYGFKASRKQYNTKISQWRFDKKVKEHEMRAIIRKQRKRKAEDPPKESGFRVRKQPVGPNKIERFKMDKKIAADIEMPDAETPSDISCYTPHVEHVEPVAQEIISVPVSPALRMLSNSPQLGKYSPGQQLMINGFSPAQTNLNHGSPPISPFIRHSSPLYWRLSPTPDQNVRSPSSLPPRHKTTSNSFTSPVQTVSRIAQPSLSPFEWFEAYVNYGSSPSSRTPSGNIIADVIRQWIMQANTYEDQRRQEALGSKWSIIRTSLVERSPSRSLETGCCKICRALAAIVILEIFLHFRACHPVNLPHRIDEDFPISEMLREALPVFESDHQNDSLDIAVRLARNLLRASRVQEAYKVLDALWQEVRHKNTDLIKNFMILEIAEIFIRNHRLTEGDEMIRDVLGFKYEIAATLAMEMTVNLDVEINYDGRIYSINGEEDSEEVRAKVQAEMGSTIDGQAIASNIVGLKALSVLQQLHKQRKVVVLDED